MSQAQRLGELLEQFGIREAFDDALKDMAKETAQAGVDGFLKALGKGALTAVSSQFLKGITGVIVSALLRHVLGATDAIDNKLNILIKAPMRTGIDEAQRAISLPANNEAQVAFRDERLAFAIDQFAIALSLSPEQPDRLGDRFVAELLRGLCAKVSSGGREYSNQVLGACMSDLQAEIGQLRELVRQLSDKAIRDDALSNEYVELLTNMPSHEIPDFDGKVVSFADESAATARSKMTESSSRIGWLERFEVVLKELVHDGSNIIVAQPLL